MDIAIPCLSGQHLIGELGSILVLIVLSVLIISNSNNTLSVSILWYHVSSPLLRVPYNWCLLVLLKILSVTILK